MATKSNLHLINVATQQELKLVKQNGVYRYGDDVVIGDLYRDPNDPNVAVLDIQNKLHPEALEALLQAESPNGQSAPRTINVGAGSAPH